MTEPTDDELDAVIAKYRTRIYPQDMHPRFERAIMRAAIAKWGTPPAVAGEPVATLHCNQDCYVWARATEAGKLLRFEEPMNLYTTPQPTQAQAGAVPLTLEAINTMAREHPAEDLCGWSYRMGIADTERHHGIKGGQHGAE